MRKNKKLNPLKDYISRAVGDFIDASERAKSVEFTIKLEEGSIPIVSYKVDELKLIQNEEDSTDDQT